MDQANLDSQSARKLGVFSYVRKPLRLFELELLLLRVMEKRGIVA